MRGDIFYEAKYLIHCIMYKGIGIEFCWVPSHCGLYWKEISDKLANQSAMKNMSEISSNNLLLSSHEMILKVDFLQGREMYCFVGVCMHD